MIQQRKPSTVWLHQTAFTWLSPLATVLPDGRVKRASSLVWQLSPEDRLRVVSMSRVRFTMHAEASEAAILT